MRGQVNDDDDDDDDDGDDGDDGDDDDSGHPLNRSYCKGEQSG